jgi:glc operon protein GlcG
MSDITVDRPTISSAAVDRVISASRAKATDMGLAAVVVVVDESGQLKAAHRMDGALLGSIQVATDKAYSAAATKTPTNAWLAYTQNDENFALGLFGIDRVCPLAGGIPLTFGNDVVGAIGVSGGSLDDDQQIALAGADALNS